MNDATPASVDSAHGLPDDQRRLVSAFELSPLMVALFDPQDVLRWCNAAYRTAFLADRPLPMAFADVLRLGFRGGFGVRIEMGDIERFLADILPRRRNSAQRTFQTDMVDGRWVLFSETLTPSGWLLTVATDITQLKQHEHTIRSAHAKAVADSQIDPLTGVSNRGHALAQAQRAFDSHASDGEPVSLALLDIDFFKRINDSHGHAAGDNILRAFCAKVQTHLRPGDIFGRFGGEEFLLVLPGADKYKARSIVERLRASIKLPDEEAPYTFSGGIAEPDDGETLDSTLRRADAALYWAKRNGRDQCALHTSFGMPSFPDLF